MSRKAFCESKSKEVGEVASTMSGRQLLSVGTGSKCVGMSAKTLYRMIERGELPAVRIGRSIRIAAEDLKAILKPVHPAAGAGHALEVIG